MVDERDPVETARRAQRVELPRRFYKQAAAEPRGDGFRLTLDGKPAVTPSRKPLAVRSRVVAEALAREWEAQTEQINPGKMPLTRIVNAAIDRVAPEMAAVAADIARHAGSDLICYRAAEPDELVTAEEAAWSPLVVWAREALGARLRLAEGAVHVSQDPEAVVAVERAVAGFDALGLAALHTVTTLTGSAILALAVARRRLTPAEAWEAAHVDEDFQMRLWGRDEIALATRAARWREMEAACLILAESGA